MLASSDRRTWICQALALALAAWFCAAWFERAAAAAGIEFPVTSVYHGQDYDPFDETAPPEVASPVSAAPASIAAVVHDDVHHNDVVHSDFHEPMLQAPDDDPFDRLPPVTNSTVTCAFQVVDFQTADFQTADYQPAGAPGQAEPLPAPQPKYEQEHSEEQAGSTWSAKPVSALTTDIVLPGGLLPKNHWQDRPQQFVPCGDMCATTRGWPVNTFTWVASCLCHNPLYFEEINLERYGYGCGCYGPCCSTCLQSAVSAGHFFGTIPALPWKMAVDCPCECDYSLGYYRPGSCPPWRYNCCTQPGCLGALAEGGVATGLIFLIP
jgi:hypothetical protein